MNLGITGNSNSSSLFILTKQEVVGSNPTSSATIILIIEYMISLINYLREKLICHFENTNIFEMAKHRTDFRNEIESIIKTLFQHFPQNKININFWNPHFPIFVKNVEKYLAEIKLLFFCFSEYDIYGWLKKIYII